MGEAADSDEADGEDADGEEGIDREPSEVVPLGKLRSGQLRHHGVMRPAAASHLTRVSAAPALFLESSFLSSTSRSSISFIVIPQVVCRLNTFTVPS